MLVCTCVVVAKAADFSLYFIKILLSWIQSSLLNELVSGSSLLAFLKVTLCSLLFKFTAPFFRLHVVCWLCQSKELDQRHFLLIRLRIHLSLQIQTVNRYRTKEPPSTNLADSQNPKLSSRTVL